MRNEQLSILKGLGIIFMVIGHSAAPTLLHNFIYLFHMPLFYFASGYFFKADYAMQKRVFVWKRVKGLYFPFVKYGILFLLLHNVFYALHIYSGEYGFMDRVSAPYTLSETLRRLASCLTFGANEQLLGAYWFLYSLFVVSVLFLFLFYFSRKLSVKHTQSLLFLSISIVCLAGGVINTFGIKLPRFFDRDLVSLFPFYLGYASHHLSWLNARVSHYSLWRMALCFLILCSLLPFGTLSLGDGNIVNPLFFLTASAVGCYFAMNLSALLPFGRRALSYIGEHTMEILTWHFLSFKLVNLLKIAIYDWDIERLAEFPVIAENNTFCWPLYTLVGVGLPLLLTLCTSKIRHLFSRCCLRPR